MLPSRASLVAVAGAQATQSRSRGRELGIPFPGQTGPLNAITDVPGIAVGHVTLIEGEGKLVPGKGPIRTGVTAILPRPKGNWDPVFAATFNLNGNGDMTGINWIKESGFMEGPILLTGTHSVGMVRDAAIKWQVDNGRQFVFTYPIVAETFDFLNDANGEHVKAAHAIQALDNAKPGRCRKARWAAAPAWAATASRAASAPRRACCRPSRAATRSACWCSATTAATSASSACRFAPRSPTSAFAPCSASRHPAWTRGIPMCAGRRGQPQRMGEHEGRGSIIVVVATDAPLLPHQLERLTRRVGMGLGRLGSWAGNCSGDLFLAFSTGNPRRGPSGTPRSPCCRTTGSIRSSAPRSTPPRKRW